MRSVRKNSSEGAALSLSLELQKAEVVFWLTFTKWEVTSRTFSSLLQKARLSSAVSTALLLHTIRPPLSFEPYASEKEKKGVWDFFASLEWAWPHLTVVWESGEEVLNLLSDGGRAQCVLWETALKRPAVLKHLYKRDVRVYICVSVKCDGRSMVTHQELSRRCPATCV